MLPFSPNVQVALIVCSFGQNIMLHHIKHVTGHEFVQCRCRKSTFIKYIFALLCTVPGQINKV